MRSAGVGGGMRTPSWFHFLSTHSTMEQQAKVCTQRGMQLVCAINWQRQPHSPGLKSSGTYGTGLFLHLRRGAREMRARVGPGRGCTHL